MNLPKINLADVPVIDTATGIFGSLPNIATASSDDRIVIIMVYIYDTAATGIPL